MVVEIVDPDAEPEVPALSPGEAMRRLSSAISDALPVMWSPSLRNRLKAAEAAMAAAVALSEPGEGS